MPATASIPIIVLASVESGSLIFPEAASMTGVPHAHEYIDKPVDPSFLLKRVKRLLKKACGVSQHINAQSTELIEKGCQST